MNDSNKKTLEAYESGVDSYVQNTKNTRSGNIRRWIEVSVRDLNKNAHILEIGSAYGRDAKIFDEMGFRIEKTDATKGFVDILQKDDPTARLLNILTDDLHDTYDLIIANAVFLHFDDNETYSAATKVFHALSPDGVFSLTLKQGEGEEWRAGKGMEPRYFNYWTSEGITRLLTEIGFSSVETWIDDSDNPLATWIMVVARK